MRFKRYSARKLYKEGKDAIKSTDDLAGYTLVFLRKRIISELLYFGIGWLSIHVTTIFSLNDVSSNHFSSFPKHSKTSTKNSNF